MRIAIYARISLDYEGKALGVERQRADCEKLCALRGWDCADYYIDNNLSAYKRQLERPAFNRLINDLKSGWVDGIVVYDLDRLTRQPSQLEEIVEVYEDRPGLVFATVQNDINLSTSDGLTMARVMIAFANKSSSDTSRRQRRKNEERAEMGLPHGSRRPYGYEADLVTIREDEAKVVREFARQVIGGHSYKECAWWANEQGYTTTQGRPWLPLTVRNLLGKPRYAGIRVHKDVSYPAVWHPILDAKTWDNLQLAMRLRQERAGHRQGMALKYLLTGLVVCGNCGMTMNGETRRDRPGAPIRRIYYCRTQGDASRKRGCGKVRRNADALDDWIKECVLYRLDTAELAKLLTQSSTQDDNLAQLLSDRKAQSLIQDGLVDDYATGLLDRAQFARAKQKAESELQRIDSEIDRQNRSRTASGLVPAGESVRSAWDECGSDDWRRSLLRLLIERITVMPCITQPSPFMKLSDGTRVRFDPLLIKVDWIA